MKNIYCISGLGANHRLFERLAVPGYKLVPVDWVLFSNEETLPEYAHRIMQAIGESNPIILGLSFGGMLAVEIAKAYPVGKVMIISSAKTRTELRIHGGPIASWVINTMILPDWFFTRPKAIALDYIGAKTQEERKLLREIIRSSDGGFVKWALKAMNNWQNDVVPQGITHIHGTADRTIPSKNVQPDFWVQGGTHMMIYNKAEEVSRIISDCLRG